MLQAEPRVPQALTDTVALPALEAEVHALALPQGEPSAEEEGDGVKLLLPEPAAEGVSEAEGVLDGHALELVHPVPAKLVVRDAHFELLVVMLGQLLDVAVTRAALKVGDAVRHTLGEVLPAALEDGV